MADDEDGRDDKNGKSSPPRMPLTLVPVLDSQEMKRLGIVEEKPERNLGMVKGREAEEKVMRSGGIRARRAEGLAPVTLYQIMLGSKPATSLLDVSRTLAENPGARRVEGGFYDEKFIVGRVAPGTYALARPIGGVGQEMVRHNDCGREMSWTIEEIIAEGILKRDLEIEAAQVKNRRERAERRRLAALGLGAVVGALAGVAVGAYMYAKSEVSSSILESARGEARAKLEVARDEYDGLAAGMVELNERYDILFGEAEKVNALLRDSRSATDETSEAIAAINEYVPELRDELADVTGKADKLIEEMVAEIDPRIGDFHDELDKMEVTFNMWKELPAMAQALRSRTKWEVRSYSWLVSAAMQGVASNRRFMDYMRRVEEQIGRRLYQQSKMEVRSILAVENPDADNYVAAFADLAGNRVSWGHVPPQQYARIVNRELHIRAQDCESAKSRLLEVLEIEAGQIERGVSLLRDVGCESVEEGVYIVKLEKK